MAQKVVRYYFSFGSPFSALADAQIDSIIEKAGADLDPIPIDAPPSEPPEGFAATLDAYKRSYQYEDAARWARKLGLAWHSSAPPQPLVDAQQASIGPWGGADECQGRPSLRAQRAASSY